MSRPLIEHRRERGPTAIASTLRRQAATERARTVLRGLSADLEGHDPELSIEVYRAIVRALGSALVLRAGEGRAVGVLVGALTDISPAWRADPRVVMAEAEAVFSGAGGAE